MTDSTLRRADADRASAHPLSARVRQRAEPLVAPRQLSDTDLILGHELRSCLNSILMSTEVLARPEFRADFALHGRQLDAIRSAVTHAEELLTGAEASAAAPAALPRSRMVLLQTLFESISKEIEGRARVSGVTLTFPRSLPRWSVDAVVARLAMSNLLVNAIKYADAGKPNRWVVVRVEAAEDDPAALVIEVADNGLGIPTELQERVLSRRFRAHPQIAEGAGLGLALTKQCLVDQGGSIELVSKEGVGTKVRVTLPMRCLDSSGG